MTTQCPILKQLLEYPALRDHRELNADLNLDALDSLAESAPYSLDYTRLRGFILIEEMLQRLDLAYETTYRIHGGPDFKLKLEKRTWQGLTDSKNEAAKMLDEVGIEVAEAQLSGSDVSSESAVQVVKSHRGARKNHKKVLAAIQLERMGPCAINNIVDFRPFLKNPDASISAMGGRAASLLVHARGDGGYNVVAGDLYRLIHKLIHVRL